MEEKLRRLNEQFGRTGVRFEEGAGGFAEAVLNNRFGEAKVMLHGAHLTSYTPAGAKPVVWMSRHSMYAENEPIRGGVPVCWPWFGPDPDGKFGGHGFARLLEWQTVRTETTPDGGSLIQLELTDRMVPERFAPQPFQLTLTVTLGAELVLALRIRNTGSEMLKYSGALHTYFAVSEAAQIQVTGLEECEYFDSVLGCEGVQHGAVVIDREIDRVYRGTSGICRIVDPGFRRAIRVAKSGSTSTVVWNPWIAKSKRMPDFGDEEYHTMVCVEAANAPRAGDNRKLVPGGMAELRQIIALETL